MEVKWDRTTVQYTHTVSMTSTITIAERKYPQTWTQRAKMRSNSVKQKKNIKNQQTAERYV